MGTRDLEAPQGTDGEASGGWNTLSRFVAPKSNFLKPLTSLDSIIYNRKKDQQTPTGKWFSALVSENPWYKDVVPDVCIYS